MAGRSRSKNGVASARLCPAILVLGHQIRIVIPGCAEGADPESIYPHVPPNHGFRVRSHRSRPGMTAINFLARLYVPAPRFATELCKILAPQTSEGAGNGFTAYSALSQVIGLCCHRRRNAKALSPYASFEASVARFPKFVRLSRPHFRELRKAKGNCNYLIPVPLTILKFLKGFAATSEELQNRRRWYHAAWPSARLSHAARGDQRPPHLPRVRGDREPPLLVGTG